MPLKSPKAKGSYYERKSKKLLEKQGYLVCKAGASLGLFDLFAVGPYNVLLVQVKSGTARLSKKDREAIIALHLGPFVEKILHQWEERAKAPKVELLHSNNPHTFRFEDMPKSPTKDKLPSMPSKSVAKRVAVQMGLPMDTYVKSRLVGPTCECRRIRFDDCMNCAESK